MQKQWGFDLTLDGWGQKEKQTHDRKCRKSRLLMHDNVITRQFRGRHCSFIMGFGMPILSSPDKGNTANSKFPWMKRQSSSVTCAESPELREDAGQIDPALGSVPPSTGGETMQERQVNHLSRRGHI